MELLLLFLDIISELLNYGLRVELDCLLLLLFMIFCYFDCYGLIFRKGMIK